MAGGANSGDDELITSINVTPLVDIVLVLLIIMMVTASYIVSKSIPMELPKAATGQDARAEKQTIAVSIDKDGKLFIEAVEKTEEQLRSAFRAAYRVDRETRAVIHADGRVPHARVVRIMDLLRQENITKFAINTRPEDLR